MTIFWLLKWVFVPSSNSNSKSSGIFSIIFLNILRTYAIRNICTIDLLQLKQFSYWMKLGIKFIINKNRDTAFIGIAIKLFCFISILERNNSIKCIRIFGVFAEISVSHELEFFAGFYSFKRLFNLTTGKLDQGIGVKEVIIGGAFRHIVKVRNSKELIIKIYVYILTELSRYPINICLVNE